MAFELFLIYTFTVAVSSYSALNIFVFILSVVVSCLYVCIVLGHGMMSQPSTQRLSLYLHTSDKNKPMPFLGMGRYIKWWIFWDEEFDHSLDITEWQERLSLDNPWPHILNDF